MSPMVRFLSLLPLLLFLVTQEGDSTQQVKGQRKADACVCTVNATQWDFPAQKYEGVSQQVESCGDFLGKMQTQVLQTEKKMPQINATVANITERLLAFEYLKTSGLYKSLHLRQLNQELQKLERDISSAHRSNPSAKTQSLTQEISKALEDVTTMQESNIFNLEAVRENLRSLRNSLETCRTIRPGFTSTCSQRLMKNISSPLVTKLSPYGKSYPAGSWGRETKPGSPETYWIQPLVSGNRHGNVVRRYLTYEDFMASRNPQDVAVAASHAVPNAIQGPGSLLYGEAFFYQCHNAGELCRYDLRTQATVRRPLPGVGYNNQFPYCYYSCRDWTDVDFSADETGLWVIYGTQKSHGNMVLSRLDAESLNVTHTWSTRLFKKSVTNAFVVCGVLYATRYDDRYREEVFYAFDTATGREDNTLALPLEKVADGVANLHYNPADHRLYMYNDNYLLAYEPYF
ncbi:olfactomedin-4-like isoform X1 [Anguilla rostrata]|uniref:olfactomedin-4-like isoform X1 n=1 Tax=Anguilla rostrata TaxID=7938 RepID=UPI0030D58271